ncbi:MAG: hypothetical protein V4629_10055 [Pseudomonadota bacterium]
MQNPQEVKSQRLELTISNTVNFNLTQDLLDVIAMEVRLDRIDFKSNKTYKTDLRVQENRVFYIEDTQKLREEVNSRLDKVAARLTVLESRNNKSYFSRLSF